MLNSLFGDGVMQIPLAGMRGLVAVVWQGAKYHAGTR